MSECQYVTVAAGELWCDTHDTHAPCPLGLYYLGTMEVAGYVLTVVASTDAEARAAILTEYRRLVRAGQVFDVTGGVDPAEYHGLNVAAMALGVARML
jgi:hypothetical protein